MYYAKERYSVFVKYVGGTYDYEDSEEMKHWVADNERIDAEKSTTAVATPMEALTIKGASKDEIKNAIQKIGIEIPENAKFEELDDGEYRFSAKMEEQNGYIIDGSLTCTYYEGKIISNLRNYFVKYEKEKQKEIISEEEAYQEILKGKFKYEEYGIEKINDIVVEDVELEYFTDSKGYYVPIYSFKVKINNQDRIIQIRAVK